MYDFIIVGSGLFGSVFANEIKKNGLRCMVIEKNNHIGGNCYTEKKDEIDLHVYGPHIFHTNDDKLWQYINKFSTFNNYKHIVRVNYDDNIFSFPINLLTFHQLCGAKSPIEAVSYLDTNKIKFDKITNLEEWALSEVGEEVYQKFIKGYTSKQWNTDPKNLPASIIKRIPIRTTYDDNYYFDKYQGIPSNGYTQIFEKMLDGIEVRLNTDFFENREYFESSSKFIVFTGKIDEYFDYKFGKLDYRSLRFENEFHNIPYYQGCAQMNFTNIQIPYTRIIEHKHFTGVNCNHTWITKEYPQNYTKGTVPFYPIADENNLRKYNLYKQLSKEIPNVIFGGRLTEYKYYDMHQVIASALSKFNKFKQNL